MMEGDDGKIWWENLLNSQTMLLWNFEYIYRIRLISRLRTGGTMRVRDGLEVKLSDCYLLTTTGSVTIALFSHRSKKIFLFSSRS